MSVADMDEELKEKTIKKQEINDCLRRDVAIHFLVEGFTVETVSNLTGLPLYDVADIVFRNSTDTALREIQKEMKYELGVDKEEQINTLIKSIRKEQYKNAKKEGKIEVIRKAIKNNMTNKDIKEITDFSLEEIDGMRKEVL